MLIKADVLDGIVDGRITCVFRWWRRPSVRAGTLMRTRAGLVRIEAVEQVDAGDVTDDDARQGGLRSRAEALRPGPRHEDARLYRIRLSYAGADPRVALRQQDDLTAGDVDALAHRLDRLDRASSRGPWTRATLQLIAERPHTLAAELASTAGVDTPRFKRDVRKLKELGLTESLDRGYRLSPRGRALTERLWGPLQQATGRADLAGVRAHCLGKPGTTEGRPFAPDMLVMKVAGKVFAIIGEAADPVTITLKCEPDEAELVRRHHAAVRPGYHMDKRHWNTVTLDGTVAATEVLGWIDDSYDLVVERLPRRTREQLGWSGATAPRGGRAPRDDPLPAPTAPPPL